jgi:hypothetical protein
LQSGLVNEGILAEAEGASKVLSVTFLDEVLGRICEQDHRRLYVSFEHRCWLSEVIRLVFGEGQRRENLERLSRLEEQLAMIEGPGPGKGASQHLLPEEGIQAAALVRLAIEETQATLAVCVPPLVRFSAPSPRLDTLPIEKQVVELERMLDTWRDANTASVQLRYRGPKKHLALYAEPEWVQDLSKKLIALRRHQFGREEDAPPELLPVLKTRLAHREDQLTRWCQSACLGNSIEGVFSADRERSELQKATTTFGENVADDPQSKLERAKRRLLHREGILQENKLAMGLELGFVKRLLRDNEELCRLREEVDCLEGQCQEVEPPGAK